MSLNATEAVTRLVACSSQQVPRTDGNHVSVRFRSRTVAKEFMRMVVGAAEAFGLRFLAAGVVELLDGGYSVSFEVAPSLEWRL